MADDQNKDSVEEEDFAAMFEAAEAQQKPSFETGDQVEATVVSLSGDTVFLDLGTRSEALLNREEVLDEDGEPTVAVGDRLTVFVVGWRQGSLRCALRFGAGDKAADNTAALAALRDAYEGQIPVEGTVKEVIKGGYRVEVMGQRAFCPISQISKVFCDTPEQHLEQTYGFQIIEYKEDGRNLVLSRRVLQEREAEERAAELWQRLEVGSVHQGTVSSLQSYGAFVDIGGIDGLVHVSEIAHTRVSDSKEVLSVGQSVQVQIKEIDQENQKISLSLKALLDDPWTAALEELTAGRTTSGRVVRLAQFGAFVELRPGVEGLVHISKMSEGKRIHHPREVVAEGAEVTVRILEIDAERKRISLALEDADAEAIRSATESYRKEQSQQSSQSMGTLGDLLQAKQKQKK